MTRRYAGTCEILKTVIQSRLDLFPMGDPDPWMHYLQVFLTGIPAAPAGDPDSWCSLDEWVTEGLRRLDDQEKR